MHLLGNVMKTVQVLLKTGKTVSFFDADVQHKQEGRIAIYDKSFRIVCEFREDEIKRWWYVDGRSGMAEVPYYQQDDVA